MNRRRRVKLVQEGHFVAEVEVDVLADDTGWSPYLSPEDACKLDDVREALRRGDVRVAAQWSRVYEMRPVATP